MNQSVRNNVRKLKQIAAEMQFVPWITLATAGCLLSAYSVASGLRESMGGGVIAGMLLMAVWAGLWLWLAGSRRLGWKSFLATACVLLLISRVGVLVTFPDYAQLGDRKGFLEQVEQFGSLLESGGDLTEMSSSYDFYSWVPRSLWIALPNRLLFDSTGHIWSFKALNVLFSVTSFLLLAGLLQNLFGTRTARFGLALYAMGALRMFTVLDYTAQFQAEAVYLCILFLAARSFNKEDKKFWQILWPTLLLTFALIVGWTLLGIDKIGILGLIILLIWRKIHRRESVSWLRAVVIPLAIYIPATIAIGRAIEEMDSHRLSSGGIAFMARGWSNDTLGEYEPDFEAIDRESEPDEAPVLMLRLIQSSILHEPLKTFAVMIPAKAIKFMLIGYASGIEQALQVSGHPVMSELFRGMRYVFAPIILASLAWALIGILGENRHMAAFLPVLTMCSISLLSCLFLAETSPRYSFYIQGLLCAIAGFAFVPAITVKRSAAILLQKKWAAHLAVAATLYVLFAAILFLTSALYSNKAIVDLRHSVHPESASVTFDKASGLKGGDVLKFNVPGNAGGMVRLRFLLQSRLEDNGNLTIFLGTHRSDHDVSKKHGQLIDTGWINGNHGFEAPILIKLSEDVNHPISLGYFFWDMRSGTNSWRNIHDGP